MTAAARPRGENYGPFTKAQWSALPMKMRQRWWTETEYGRKAPSQRLLDDCTAVLTEAAQ